MISRILLQNIAIVSQLSVSLEPGLTVITGESGSGKSLVLEAIALAFGLKVPPKQVLKSGCSKGLVEVILQLADVDDTEKLAACLQTFQFDCEVQQETEWSLSREITPQSSRFRLNGIPVTRELVEAIRPWFVDIHGQHELHQLFSPTHQLAYLDTFGGVEIRTLKKRVSEAYTQWHLAHQQHQSLLQTLQATAQNRDFLLFQLTELDQAAVIHPDEDETLRQELRRLSCASQFIQAAQYGYAVLQDDRNSQQPALLDQLNRIQKKLVSAGGVGDTVLQGIHERIEQVICELQQVSEELASYPEQIDTHPERLAELTERLDVLEKLKRKYGPTLQQLMAHHTTLTQQLEDLDSSDSKLKAVEHHLEASRGTLQTACTRLTQMRQQCAGQFKLNIKEELQSLAMPGVSFDIELTQTQFSEHGADSMMFLFSANPGEPLRPLAQVASGGELSRFLLAAKVIQAQSGNRMSLLFDEIDTGISGPTAKAVAKKMIQLSHHHQVIAITHQPMIAVLGQQHLHVTKKIEHNGNTHAAQVVVESIANNPEKRQEALAQLISGATGQDETTRRFIAQLQVQAQEICQNTPCL
jgi:DNA repair protein RecN (Recombination protein N)